VPPRRVLPGQCAVHHGAEREQVTLAGQGFTPDLLRRHVQRRARVTGDIVVLEIRNHGATEVRDLDHLVRADEDVVRFDVAVYHAPLMGVVERRGALVYDLDALPDRQ
jgi:hypothetical protein